MGNGAATGSRPEPPKYRQVSHRAHIQLALATFGMWFPFWAMIATAVALSSRRARKRYERSLIDWALAQCEEDGGERLKTAAKQVA